MYCPPAVYIGALRDPLISKSKVLSKGLNPTPLCELFSSKRYRLWWPDLSKTQSFAKYHFDFYTAATDVRHPTVAAALRRLN
jgi:hypothetical protein